MPDPIRMAIAEVLEADGTLGDLAPGGVHWRHAPQGAKPPLVIFSKSTGVRIKAFGRGDNSLRNTIWTVKGVGFADDAEDIDSRCQELLAGASLPGVNLRLAPLPEGDISYEEGEHGEMNDHNGTEYRVMSE